MIRLKKWTAWILIACLLLGLTACGRQEEESDTQAVASLTDAEESTGTEIENTDKEETDIDVQTIHEPGQEHILIAYFSWADNTVVEDEEAAVQSALSHYESIGDRGNYSDVDAVSSASVVKPGNTAKMAQWIQEYVGGDLFSIVVTELYPDNYDECLDRAADEKAENARPELAEHLDNMDDYDVIFLGFPNWWYTAPMAVFTFIEEYDLSGKTVIPFCTHGGYGAGSSYSTIREASHAAESPDGLALNAEEVLSEADIVAAWLENIDMMSGKD